MGSHTDYNEGHVLTMAIDRYTWVAAAPVPTEHVFVQSLNVPDRCEFRTDGIRVGDKGDWGNYIKGVVAGFQDSNFAVPGFNAIVWGHVPLASGLSSSASLECALAVLLEKLGGHSLERLRMAKICQRAEHEYAGVRCGILDQYSALFGEAGAAVLLDCRTITHRNVKLPAGLTVVICNTKAPRKLATSEYTERREACETAARMLGHEALRDVSIEEFAQQESKLPKQVAKRARFIVEENARVLSLAEALEKDERDAIGRITEASFKGARDLFEIVVPEMEAMMLAMRESPGCVGARQAGAGFGGCMVAFVEKQKVDEFQDGMKTRYQRLTKLEPSAHMVEASGGAEVFEAGS
jgi:galactokinase